MNDNNLIVQRQHTGPRYANLWVLVLLAVLWIVSIVLYVPGMP